jgi:phage terminase large subunit-like protein
VATVAPQKRRPVPMQAFTLEHFKRYTANIVLDTGDPWEIEDFQLEIVEPILAGVKEVWAILPEGNAKTTLMAGFGLYHCDFTTTPWVPIAASSRDQAEIMARQAYDMIRNSPGMERRFRIYEGYREIRSLRNGGRGIKVYAADAGTGDGVIPTLAICDEGHRHPNLDLYRLWAGKLRKRAGQIVMISTAGEPGSEFEEARDNIRAAATNKVRRSAAHMRYEGPSLTLNEWRLPKAGLASNMTVVKACNPLSTITEATLQEDFASPTTKLNHWLRLKCNIPARMETAAVTEQEWDGAEVEDVIPLGRHIDVGLDVGWKHDTTAFQPLYTVDGYMLLGDPEVLTPPGGGIMLHPQELKDAFDRINDRNPVDTVVMDMSRAEDISAWLEDERGVRVIDRPQGNANAAEDYEDFMAGLRNGTMNHTGHPHLRAHVMHAIARRLPSDKMRFDRPASSRGRKKQERRVIDCLVAAGMVVNYVMHPPEDDDDGLPGDVEDYRILSLASS